MLLRLLELKLCYWMSRLLDKKTVLVTKGASYFIDPEACRYLQITRKGVRFVGTWYGMSKIYNISLKDVIGIYGGE